MPMRSSEFVAAVRALAAARCRRMAARLGERIDAAALGPGKMLRARLAGRLAACESMPADRDELVRLAAAVEMLHTASLCHDDVIDDARVRRSRPTLWRSVGRPAAILIGDLLFCEAMALVRDIAGGRHLPDVLAGLHEVVSAEAEQELLLRGRRLDEETCLRVARQKTGPLFALLAGACGGDDAPLRAALTESGYRIGTAYQLADDLLDAVGSEERTGKTLGRDALRRKYTLVASLDGDDPYRRVSDLCASAAAGLADWPWAAEAVACYVREDLTGVFGLMDEHLGARVRAEA